MTHLSSSDAKYISIIGAGAVGAAHAAFLREKGYDVILSYVGNRRGITSTFKNESGLIKVHGKEDCMVHTYPCEEAVEKSDIIFLTLPASAHRDALLQISHMDLSKKIFVVLPGNGFTMLARTILPANNFPMAIFEAPTAPYATRFTDQRRLAILFTKKKIQISGGSRAINEEYKQRIGQYFSQPLEWYDDKGTIFFYCVNALVHPAAMLAAKQAICSGDVEALFYRTFVPKAAELIQKLDNEREAIMKLCNFHYRSIHELNEGWYGLTNSKFLDFYETFPILQNVRVPCTMEHRFLTEDVKCLLILMRDIGMLVGAKTPHMNDIIEETSQVLNEDVNLTGVRFTSVGLTTSSTLVDIVAVLNGDNTARVIK